MERNRKRFIAPLLGLAAIIVAVAIYLMVTMTSKDVDMPRDDASPTQVVAAYMEALDAHDCDTAMALRTDGSRDVASTWCGKVAGMTDARVVGQHSEAPEASGRTAPDEVMNVRVTFDLGWRMFRNDGSDAGGAH